MTVYVSIRGELVGYRKSEKGVVVSEIVHITTEARPVGPADNAFVEVELGGQIRRGRYLSWINYFDIEYARSREVGQWQIVEPPQEYSEKLQWLPFGWDGLQPVPTIGDSILEQLGDQGRYRVAFS
jgi:hypothetical protein